MVLNRSPSKGGKPRDQLALEAKAANAISEWRLVKDGVSAYARMGYATPDGQEWAVKMMEYLIIDSAVSEAHKVKRGNKD